MSYDQLFARAAAEAGEWRTLTLNLPADANAATVRFGVDRGNGAPQLRRNLTLDADRRVQALATVLESIDRAEARSWIRFLHTGEALGIVGQTIAGIVSLTSVLMV